MRPTPRSICSFPATCLALLVFLASSSLAHAQAFTLGARVDLSVDNDATAISAADLNGDGKPDLMTCDRSLNQLVVRLGDGLGGYGATSAFTTGASPYGLAVADLNGDGRPDAITSNAGGNTISVLLGNGAGGFGPRTDLATGSGPFSVATGDLNGDGRSDLVVGNYYSSTVSVFLGNGGGGFAPRVDYSSGLWPWSVAIGELSGDGKPDVVVATLGTSTISRFLGDGAGGLGSLATFATVSAPNAVAIGDLNHDGRADLAVASDGVTYAISVLLASGPPGSFGPSTYYGTIGHTNSMVISDLDGDNNADLATNTRDGDTDANAVTVWKGDGMGSFGSRQDLDGLWFGAVAVEDVNGDGRRDLLAAGYGVSLFLGGGGGFGPKTDFPTGIWPNSVAIGDVSGDGRPDLAVANYGSNTVSVLLGTGGGTFGPKTDFLTGNYPASVAIGDLNGDGRLDLAVANYLSNSVSVLLGTGGGSFAAKTDFVTGTNPNSVAIGDVSGDGRLDLAVANNLSNSVSVLLGTGGGSFAAKTDFVAGANPVSVAIGDVSGDGRPDLVVANIGYPSVSVLLGTGGGSFAPKTDFVTGTNPQSVAIGDVSGDGRPDLAVANYGSNSVSVLLGTGGGSFGPNTDFVTGTRPVSVAIGDVNRDGRPDLAVANYGSNNMSVLLGTGSGGFGPRTDFPTGGSPASVALGDLNGDGRPDLALANNNSADVSVLLSQELTRAAVSSSLPPVVGVPMTLTAMVSVPAPGSGTPTGVVSFFDGTTLLGTATLGGTVARLTVPTPYIGTRTFTAFYGGDGKFLRSYSPPLNQKVLLKWMAISRVRDVAGDHGGQARIYISPNPQDQVGAGAAIVRYDVYRRIDSTPALAGRSVSAAALRGPVVGPLLSGWDAVGSVSARCDTIYSLVVPTVLDSSVTGTHRATFFVSAATATPSVYYDSPSDSGYSVDNLVPAPPSPFTAAYVNGTTYLHWGANTEPDFWYYNLYRGSSPSFTPSAINRIATQPDTGYVDVAGAPYYYKIAAANFSSLQSGYALAMPSGTTGVDEGTVVLALDGARPNPARGGALMLHFSLPDASPATLELVDISGRRVLTREVGSLGAGRHALNLAAGRTLRPGVYLARLSHGSEVRATRVSFVE